MASKRALGRMLIWIGGCWTLLWGMPLAFLVVQILRQPSKLSGPAGGEYVGGCVLAAMMMAPGLVLVIAGIAAERFGRTCRESCTPEWPAGTERRKRPRLRATAGTLISALAGCSAAFMLYSMVLAPLLAVCGIRTAPMIGALAMLGVAGLGAVIGIVVGRHFVDR